MRGARVLLQRAKRIEENFNKVDRSIDRALTDSYLAEDRANFDPPATPETFEGKVAATPELADVYLSVNTRLGKGEILIKPVEGNPTGLTGLFEHPNPNEALLNVYEHTLALIKDKFPPTSVYRTAVENLIEARREIVRAGGTREEIENKVGSGLVEEILVQAADEFRLAEQLANHKVWEDLEESPLPDQWVAHAVKSHEPHD